MKKVKLILVFILLFSIKLLAQYSTDWIRPAADYQKTGVMMARDNLDNVTVTGYWVSNNMYTRKYNKFGVLQWEAISASGIASNYEKPLWVTTDNNNNVFVAGYRYAGTSSPIAVIVLKYSPDGIQLWKKVVSPVNALAGMSLRCEVDNNGNLYVGACGVGALPGFALIKFDTNGNILFTQHSDVNAPKSFASMRLKGNRVVLTASSGNLSLAPIAVWDTTGALLWTAGLLGRGGADVEMDDAGNVYLLTGYDNQVTPTSAMDIEIYKFNSSGTQLWVQNFDFGGSDFPTRFTLVADRISVIGYGNIASSYFDWITFQINTSGTMLWNTRYNETTLNDELSYFIAAKANGEVFVTGWGGPVYTQFGNSYLRMITTKYDDAGVRKWVDSVNIYSGRGIACTLASDNSLFVLSNNYTTAFHFLDHDGSAPAAIPAGVTVSNITNTSGLFSWTPVSGASLYHIRYKLTAASNWTVTSTNATSINITGLLPATSYDYACEAINSGGPSGYSPTQTFTTASVPLAVTGITFTAQRQEQNVLLAWSTLSEQNSAWFDVERSFDGIHFTSIVQLPAAGNSFEVRNYRFVDINTVKSLVFYRLKMVDADAGYRLSPVRLVPKLDGSDKEFLMYPNPASSNLSILLNETSKESLQLQIINSMGQCIRQVGVSKGIQLFTLDVRGLPKGIYMVRLTGNQFIKTNKLLLR